MIYSFINSNLSHVCGNITSIVMNDLKRKFPKKFFKSEHVSTEIAVKQFRNVNSFEELKKEKPILIIQPKINPDLTDFAQDSFHRLFGNNTFDLARPSFHNIKLIKDFEKKVFVDFGVDRLKMNFEFDIVLSTEYQEINLYSHLLNVVRFERPYYLPMLFEVEIPDGVIRQISKDIDMSIEDEVGSVEPFLNKLNKLSSAPITFKLQTGTYKYKFFMLLQSKIFMTFERPSIGEGDKNGQIVEDYTITFTLNTEFNYPSCYYYISNAQVHNEIDEGENFTLSADNIQLHLPLQNVVISEIDENEYSLFISSLVEIDNEEEDIINIKPLFNKHMLDVIDYCKLLGNVQDKYINITMMENEDLIEDKSHYSFDVDTFDLKMYNLDKDKNYRISVYMNNEFVNAYDRQFDKY